MTSGGRISPLLALLSADVHIHIDRKTTTRISSHIYFSLRSFLATDIIKIIISSVLQKTVIRSIRKSADNLYFTSTSLFSERKKRRFFSVLVTYFFFPKNGSVSNACTLWWFLAATKPDIHIKITLIVSLWKEGKLSKIYSPWATKN